MVRDSRALAPSRVRWVPNLTSHGLIRQFSFYNPGLKDLHSARVPAPLGRRRAHVGMLNKLCEASSLAKTSDTHALIKSGKKRRRGVLFTFHKRTPPIVLFEPKSG